MTYLNFTLDLTAQSDGKFCISVQESPVGQTSVVVDNPFTPEEIETVLKVLGRRQRGTSKLEEMQVARQFGQRLFQFLIRENDDIHAAYFASLDRAGKTGLRIRLSVEKAGMLANVPWELLCDPARDFLALSRSTPIVRFTQQLTLRPPVPNPLPLRILVMIAAPTDFPALNVENEWDRLQSATADLQKRGLVHLERLDSATLIALQRRLRAEDYHVFHYIGHSDFDDATQQGVLVLENEKNENKAQLVTGAALSRELGEESTIRLVVINSCESAQSVQQDVFSGIASGIVARGIPSVVAMQFPITDAAARVFTEEFYRTIAELIPIDSAMSEARRAIANRLQNTEWATPILYMRTEDGVLFRPVQPAIDLMPVTPQLPLPLPILAALGLLALVLLLIMLVSLRPPGTPPQNSTDTPILTQKADLQVVSIRSAPARPAPGQVFRLLIGIRNAGEVDSGPFNWTWDASPTRRNALEGRIENIAPGALQSISFPYSYGWWGSYSSLINVDIDGDVDETDERNNRDAVVMELDPTSPFIVDFTLLPNNEIVVPPRLLAANEFSDWNMSFLLAGAECSPTPLHIIEIAEFLALSPDLSAVPTCAAQTLVIALRQPVSNAEVAIIPATSGDATIRFYSDLQGTALIHQQGPLPVLQADISPFLIDELVSDRVQRIEISAPGERVQLAQLTLLP